MPVNRRTVRSNTSVYIGDDPLLMDALDALAESGHGQPNHANSASSVFRGLLYEKLSLLGLVVDGKVSKKALDKYREKT